MKVVILLILPLLLRAQDNYVFGPSIMVNDDTAGIHFHNTTQRSIACRGDTVYLVWRDDRYEYGTHWNARIFFSKSTDAGMDWNPNLLISQNVDTLDCFLPHLALDALGNIFVAYCTQNNNYNGRDVYFTKSTDGGVSFTSPRRVNDSTVVQWQTFCACAVDSSGQNVYVVWEDKRNPQYDVDIYLGRSTDGGQSFLQSVRVNDDLDSIRQWVPVVACDNAGRCVYVAWMDFRDTLHGASVYFCRSTDSGSVFEQNYRINDTLFTAGWPTLCYKNGTIYCAWRDGRDGYAVYFAKSTDNGLTFGPDVRVPDDSSAHGAYPSIAADDSGNVFVVWYDVRRFNSTGYDIYFSYSNDSGFTFQPNVRVNDLMGIYNAWDTYPAVASNRTGDIFVAWDTDRNDPSGTYPDIYFAQGRFMGVEEKGDAITEIIDIQAYPNPFSMCTGINFATPAAPLITHADMPTTVKIFDASGRIIRIYTITESAGISVHCVVWDGTDNAGKAVPSGVYFVCVDHNDRMLSKKVIKIK